jgi:Flp pilus assembly protein TadD
VLHLAHLFVARVHDDAGRPQEALRAYRAALRLQPTSHPAAMGLADALQLAGQPAEARATVEEALEVSGRRPPPQSFWEYTFGTPGEAAELLDRLRDDVSR